MIYWRIIVLLLFIAGVCLFNMPGQIEQIEYSLAHNRTRMLEHQYLDARKEEVILSRKPYSVAYLDSIDKLGWVFYQLSKVEDADAMFLKALELSEAHKATGFDPYYARSLVNIATYFRERANYPKSELYFKKLRDYDILYARGADIRKARDLGNLALVYFLWAETLQEEDKRAELLVRAESYCETALDEYRRLPGTERSQGDVMATQALALRDLGMTDRADVVARKSRQILADADNKSVEP